jgi:DNA gyrase/topoisomerase IV subunit B
MDEWLDSNVIAYFGKESCTTERALYELVANAFDANAAAGVSAPPTIRAKSDKEIVIEDSGLGIKKKRHFCLASPHRK